MAVTFKIRERGNDSQAVDLVYDAATQAEYQLYKGSQSVDGPVNPRFHVPDNAPPQLISLIPENRVLFFTLNVAGTDWDDTLNGITTLARLIDGGEDQQAARYWLHGDVPRVELVVQPDGATNETIIPIIYGEAVTIDPLFSEFGESNEMAFGVPVTLIVTPEGEGNPITLRNELGASPHMLQEGSTSGLAAGLNLVGSPTSYSLDAQYGLIKQSQKMTVPGSGTVGFKTDAISAPPGTACEAYAWILVDTPGARITVYLYDGGNNLIDSETTDNPDLTVVDYKNNTWVRVRVSGTNTTAANLYLQVARDTADASISTTWHTDLLHLSTAAGGNLAPTPSMDIDDDSDGIADGWIFSGTSVGENISTTSYFSSPASQELGDVSGTTKLVAIIFYDTSQELNVSAWLLPIGGSGNTIFEILDDEDNVLDTVTIVPSSPSGYERTATGDDTNTWYKYALSYGTSGPRPQYIKVVFRGSANNIFIDDVVITAGTLTVSNAWISQDFVMNRNDADASNPERVNTVDIWNIPGDAPAVLTLKFTNLVTAASVRYKSIFLAGRTDGEVINPDFEHWFDSTDLDSSTGTATADATRSGGSYRRFSSSAAFYWNITSVSHLKQFCTHPRRVLALARSSSTSNSLQIYNAAGIVQFPFDGEVFTFPVANKWLLIDLGVINPVGLHNQHMLGVRQGSVSHQYYATVSTGTVDMDWIYHFPVEDGRFLWAESDSVSILGSGHGFVVDGESEQVVFADLPNTIPAAGALWRMNPGPKATRVYWAMSLDGDNNYEHYITDSFEVTAVVVPRTRHLLGTA